MRKLLKLFRNFSRFFVTQSEVWHTQGAKHVRAGISSKSVVPLQLDPPPPG